MEKNSKTERKFLLTSLDCQIKSINNEGKKEDLNTILIGSKSLPKIRYRTLDKNENSKKEKIILNNIRQFISPIKKSNLEIEKLKKIRKNLIVNKFKELHDYKLSINPKNYYKNYGLNNFIIIKNRNKSRNLTYKYNNISSYNNIFKTNEENKNYKIIKYQRKEKDLLLTCVPYLIKNAKHNDGIFKNFNNSPLIDENSLWRGKNINNMIHNSINIDFFKNFLKNSKSLGKIKIFK